MWRTAFKIITSNVVKHRQISTKNKKINFTDSYLSHIADFYVNKISGTKTDIYLTLELLKIKPIDTELLEKLVLNYRRNVLGKHLEESTESKNVNSY